MEFNRKCASWIIAADRLPNSHPKRRPSSRADRTPSDASDSIRRGKVKECRRSVIKNSQLVGKNYCNIIVVMGTVIVADWKSHHARRGMGPQAPPEKPDAIQASTRDEGEGQERREGDAGAKKWRRQPDSNR